MTPRSNLSDFIKERCIEAGVAALDGGGELAEALAQRLVDDVLRSPAVLLRVKRASPHERAKIAELIPEFVRELQERGFAPPSALTPQVPDLMNVEPPAVKGMLLEAAATVIAKADEALKESSVDAAPPSQSDLAAWIGHCPPQVLTDAEARLAVLWGLKPKQVRVDRLGLWRAGDVEGWCRVSRAGRPSW